MILLGLEVLAATYVGKRLLGSASKQRRKAALTCIADNTQHGNEGSGSEKAGNHQVAEQAVSDAIPLVQPEPGDSSRKALRNSSVAVVTNVTVAYFYPVLSVIGLAALSYVALPVLNKTMRNLRRRNSKKINNDLLNSVVMLGCITTGSYIIGSVMLWFMYLGDILASNIQNNTKKLLTQTLDSTPQKVWLLCDGVEYEVDLDKIQAGDILLFSTGEVIAVDGVVVEGMAMLDQHTLTGESAPVEKLAGDQVFASTLVVSGRLQVKVEKCGVETAISQITQILLNTADFKMSLQTKGEQWADKMAKPLLLIGGGLLPFIGVIPAMTVLYSGPGNMLKTFISLQLLSHMTLFSKNGILVKDGRTLEIIPTVDTVLFDKTGTLTQETPEIGRIHTFSGYSANTVLRSAAMAELRLAHPIARAIVQHARQQNLTLDEKALETADYKVGYGIEVTVDGQHIQVGSLRFMKLQGITVPVELLNIQQNLQATGNSMVAVSINGMMAGALEICTPIRPEVREVIKKLRESGINHIAIVSGDHKDPTCHLAETLGMDDYFYDVLPQGKADIVKKLQAEGRTVCFVGDGVNDAIAIKQSQVSVSLSGATVVANDLAQVVLMEGGLARLPVLFGVSKQLKQRGLQSLGLCCTYGLTTFAAGSVFRIGLAFPMTIGTANYVAGLAHSALPLLAHKKQ